MRQNGQRDPASSSSEDIAVIVISKIRNKRRSPETKQKNKICNYEITPIIR